MTLMDFERKCAIKVLVKFIYLFYVLDLSLFYTDKWTMFLLKLLADKPELTM